MDGPLVSPPVMFRVRSLLIIQHILRCPTTAQFTGVIHLHDLSRDRENSLPYPTEYMKARLLMTTKWDKAGSDAAAREGELKASRLGKSLPNTFSFQNTPDSAWQGVDRLLGIGLLDFKLFRKDLDRICTIYENKRIDSQKLRKKWYRFPWFFNLFGSNVRILIFLIHV